MQILLTAATRPEIQPTIDFLGSGGGALGNSDRTALGGLELDVLITGVGQAATLYSLLKRVQARRDQSDRPNRPDLVLQAGIAGCFTGKNPGEVVVVKEEIPDMGVWEEGRFKTIFDMGLTGPDAAPFSGGLLVNPYTRLLRLTGLEQVRAISVNEITTDPARIQWLQQNGQPVVESMEGAALHYVCLQEGLPFLQLRSVSNEIGVRDKGKWNIPLAIGELNKKLTGLLNGLAGEGTTILEK